MKKFTAITIFLIILVSSAPSYAQDAPHYCSTVDANNYNLCCTQQTSSACQQYEQSGRFCIDFPQDPRCVVTGQVGAGSVNTNPVNSSDTPPGSSTPGAAQPRGSSSLLTTCNVIQFKSALDILIWLKCVIVAAIIPLIFAVAFFFFLWGVFQFMIATTAEKRKEGRQRIWWGLIALFVMVSVWGIIKILSDTVGTGSAVPFLQTDYLNPGDQHAGNSPAPAGGTVHQNAAP